MDLTFEFDQASKDEFIVLIWNKAEESAMYMGDEDKVFSDITEFINSAMTREEFDVILEEELGMAQGDPNDEYFVLYKVGTGGFTLYGVEVQ